MLAASYAINDLYFAGTYVDGQDKSGVNKKDKTGYELAAKYTMQQTVFTTSYNYLESKTSGQKLTKLIALLSMQLTSSNLTSVLTSHTTLTC
jgi:outer membrane protein OmpU